MDDLGPRATRILRNLHGACPPGLQPLPLSFPQVVTIPGPGEKCWKFRENVRKIQGTAVDMIEKSTKLARTYPCLIFSSIFSLMRILFHCQVGLDYHSLASGDSKWHPQLHLWSWPWCVSVLLSAPLQHPSVHLHHPHVHRVIKPFTVLHLHPFGMVALWSVSKHPPWRMTEKPNTELFSGVIPAVYGIYIYIYTYIIYKHVYINIYILK